MKAVSVLSIIGGMAMLLCGQSPGEGSGTPVLREASRLPVAFDFGGKRTPLWSDAGLLVVENSGTRSPRLISLGGGSGERHEIQMAVPDVTKFNVYGFTARRDGSVIAGGSAFASDGRGTSILVFSGAKGTSMRVVRVAPFAVFALSAAPDGTVWAAGGITADHEGEDHFVLRKFDTEGRETGGWVLRSSLPKEIPTPASTSLLSGKGTRVGWYSPAAGVYIEVPAQGGAEIRFPGVSLGGRAKVNGLALCENGSAWVSSFESGAWWGLWKLDREAAQWKRALLPVEQQSSPWGRVYGCEGNRLVVSTRLPELILMSAEP